MLPTHSGTEKTELFYNLFPLTTTMELIDGKKMAETIKAEIAAEVEKMIS